jgi:oligopeptide/dipeptide ABC transporter ATP-binding protein
MMSALQEEATPSAREDQVVLRAEHLVKEFPLRRGMTRATPGVIHAVDAVSFSVHAGQTLALVGESGCGKSTTARMLANLITPTSGSVLLGEAPVASMSAREQRRAREQVQVVFQDPYASLNPKMRARDIVAEPLRAYHRYSESRIKELFEMVQLDYSWAKRRPAEFSGGQRQRLNIARALALEPQILLLDEPTSALDVSIQAQILTLLRRLQAELRMTYVIISHDLAVVRQMADHVAVMYLGEIVEIGSTESVFVSPRHPYTCALLSAISAPDPHLRGRERIVLKGDPPSAANPPAACRFHTRCWKAQDQCRTEKPSLAAEGERGHDFACHFPESRTFSERA